MIYEKKNIHDLSTTSNKRLYIMDAMKRKTWHIPNITNIENESNSQKKENKNYHLNI